MKCILGSHPTSRFDAERFESRKQAGSQMPTTRNMDFRWLAVTLTFSFVLSCASSAMAGKKDDDDDDDNDRGASAPAAAIAPGYLRAPYLQSLASDSVLVAWMATDPGDPAVDFGTTPDYGTTVLGSADGSRRFAVLRGLSPGTRYFYRVRAGKRILADGSGCSFRTDEGRGDSRFNFFVSGDIGDKGGRQNLTAKSILRIEPRPEIGILCGDIVYSSGRSSDYDARLMRPWQDLLSTIPVWPALGNHDWKSPPSSNWQQEWYLPNNEHYYSFDYANAHFIALDTRDGNLYDTENQVAWLQDDLQKNAGADWTFIYFHHPGITCTYKKNNEAVITHFLPLFDRYKVDAVFTGHAHTYERLYPIRQGQTVSVEQDPHYTDPEGTLYITSGAGGKVKKGKPTKRCGPTAFARDETILWTQVFVDGARCTIRTYESANDSLVDEVSIMKTRLAQSTSP